MGYVRNITTYINTLEEATPFLSQKNPRENLWGDDEKVWQERITLP